MESPMKSHFLPHLLKDFQKQIFAASGSEKLQATITRARDEMNLGSAVIASQPFRQDADSLATHPSLRSKKQKRSAAKDGAPTLWKLLLVKREGWGNPAIRLLRLGKKTILLRSPFIKLPSNPKAAGGGFLIRPPNACQMHPKNLTNRGFHFLSQHLNYPLLDKVLFRP